MYQLYSSVRFAFAGLLLLIVAGASSAIAEASTRSMAYDFEGFAGWYTYQSDGASVMMSADYNTKKEGRSSVKLQYNFSTTSNNFATLEREIGSDMKALSEETDITAISFWLYNHNSQPNLRLWVKLSSDNSSEYESYGWWESGGQYDLSAAGWRKIVVPLEEFTLTNYTTDPDRLLDKPFDIKSARIVKIGLDDAQDSATMSGAVSIDELVFHTDGAPDYLFTLDSVGDWTTGVSGTGNPLLVILDGENNREGNAGLSLSYSFNSNNLDSAFILRDVSGLTEAASPDALQRVTLWAFSPTPQPDASIGIRLIEEDSSVYEAERMLDFSGWQRLSFPLSDFALSPFSSDVGDPGLQIADVNQLAIFIEESGSTSNPSGQVLIDELRFDAPDPSSVSIGFSDNPASGNIDLYALYEAKWNINRTYINPYDADIIDATAYMTRPDGSTAAIPAYWYEDYTRSLVGDTEILIRNPAGDGWKLRYSPRELGQYSYYIEMREQPSNLYIRYPSSGDISFSAVASDNKGFLNVSATDSNYMEYSDHSPYIGIGHNLNGWEWDGEGSTGTSNSVGTYEYDAWLDAMYANGANMTHFDFSEGDQIEWTGGDDELPFSEDWNGLVHYNQQTAWKMDHRFHKAEQYGIAFRLTLSHWEDFDEETGAAFPHWGWNRNPYNASVGGTAESVTEFFKDYQSRLAYKKYLRYVTARYAYSTSVMAWELWNEVDNADYGTKGYHEALVTDWHIEMSRYFKQIDPNHHPVTTSFANTQAGNALWNNDAMDLTTFHRYTYYNQFYPDGYKWFDTEELMAKLVEDRRGFGKPALVGEWALSPGGDIQRDYDPEGIAFHNQLWASVMSKALGTAMHWTWGSYIHANNLYGHYAPLQSFLKDVDPRGMTAFRNFDTGRTNIMAFNMDSAFGWTPSIGNSATLSVTEGSRLLKEGNRSVRMGYHFSPTGSQGEFMERNISSDISSKTIADIDRISFWVYNDAANPDVRLYLKLTEQSGGGEYEPADWTAPGTQYQLNWTGWRKIEIPLSAMTLAPYSSDAIPGLQLGDVTLVKIGMHNVSGSSDATGFVHIDDLIFSDSIRVMGMKATDKAIGWAQDYRHTFVDRETAYSAPVLTNQTYTLTGMSDGVYTVEFHNTYDGTVTVDYATASGGLLTIGLPDFSKDIAFKVSKT